MSAVVVRRAGRKRKLGERKPSGDLIGPADAQRAIAHRRFVGNQPHRRELPREVRVDPRAETPFGRLNLTYAISDLEYKAGRIYAAMAGRYRTMIEAPKATPSSVGVMIGNGSVAGAVGFACWCGGHCPSEEVAREVERPCEASRRKHDYERAHVALRAAGWRAAHAVNRMAVWFEPCPAGMLDDLLCGLRGLVKYFALYEKGKS